MKLIITDLGKSIEVTSAALGDTVIAEIPRYGVWKVDEHGKASVIDTGRCIEVIKKIYGDDLEIFKI